MNPLEPPLLVLVTEPRDDLKERIRDAVAGGVDIVIWRDRAMPELVRRLQAPALREAAQPARFFVNGSVSLATATRADGLHLSETAPPLSRSEMETGILLGRSAHSLESAEQAAREADYLLAGTLFESGSHPGKAPEGLDMLQSVCRAVSIPVIGIGGVTPDRVGECLRAGAAGVAVVSGILHAADTRKAAAEYRTRLNEEWERCKSL